MARPTTLLCVAATGIVALAGLLVGCSSDALNASVVSWEITDACDDQMGLQVRFFDEDTGQIWPNESSVWLVEEFGTEIFVVDCARDRVICFGATTHPATAASWGAGINGDENCADCCAICGDGAFPEDSLSCP